MTQEEMVQMLRNHQTALYGNGRPGLIETLAAFTASVRSMEANMTRLMDLAGETRDQVTAMSSRDEVARQGINEALTGLRNSQEGHAGVVEGWIAEFKATNTKEHDGLSTRIDPLEKFTTRYIWAAAALSGGTFLLGMVIVFMVSNWENLVSMVRVVKP